MRLQVGSVLALLAYSHSAQAAWPQYYRRQDQQSEYNGTYVPQRLSVASPTNYNVTYITQTYALIPEPHSSITSSLSTVEVISSLVVISTYTKTTSIELLPTEVLPSTEDLSSTEPAVASPTATRLPYPVSGRPSQSYVVPGNGSYPTAPTPALSASQTSSKTFAMPRPKIYYPKADNETCGGATLNVVNAHLDYWYTETYTHTVSTVSVQFNANDSQTGWSILPATTDFDISTAITQQTCGSSTSVNTAYNVTITNTNWDCYTTPTPVASSTTLLSVDAFTPTNQTTGNGTSLPNIATEPPLAVATLPSAAGTYTEGTPFVYFSEYQIESSQPTTLPNGSEACAINTRMFMLNRLFSFAFDDDESELSQESLASEDNTTGEIHPEFLRLVGETNSVTAGSWIAAPTVIVVVERAVIAQAVLAVTQTAENGPLITPTPTLPDFLSSIDPTTPAAPTTNYSPYVEQTQDALIVPTPVTRPFIIGRQKTFVAQIAHSETTLILPTPTDATVITTNIGGKTVTATALSNVVSDASQTGDGNGGSGSNSNNGGSSSNSGNGNSGNSNNGNTNNGNSGSSDSGNSNGNSNGNSDGNSDGNSNGNSGSSNSGNSGSSNGGNSGDSNSGSSNSGNSNGNSNSGNSNSGNSNSGSSNSGNSNSGSSNNGNSNTGGGSNGGNGNQDTNSGSANAQGGSGSNSNSNNNGNSGDNFVVMPFVARVDNSVVTIDVSAPATQKVATVAFQGKTLTATAAAVLNAMETGAGSSNNGGSNNGGSGNGGSNNGGSGNGGSGNGGSNNGGSGNGGSGNGGSNNGGSSNGGSNNGGSNNGGSNNGGSNNGGSNNGGSGSNNGGGQNGGSNGDTNQNGGGGVFASLVSAIANAAKPTNAAEVLSQAMGQDHSDTTAAAIAAGIGGIAAGVAAEDGNGNGYDSNGQGGLGSNSGSNSGFGSGSNSGSNAGFGSGSNNGVSGGSNAQPERLGASPGQVITVGGASYTASPVQRLFIGGQTVVPGGAPITVDGTVISVPASTNAVVIDGSTRPLAGDFASSTAFEVDGMQITAQPGVGFPIAGQTLQPGGPAITVDGTRLSLAPGGTALVIGSSTSAIAAAAGAASGIPELTVGSQIFTANAATQFFLAPGQTLTPGGTAVISGTTISLDSKASAIVINGQTRSFGSSPDATITSPPEIIRVNGQAFAPNAGGTYLISGQTLSPGGRITVTGSNGIETLSLASSGTELVVAVSGHTITSTLDASVAAEATSAPILTIGGQTFTALPGTDGANPTYLVNGETLTAGEEETVTVAGKTYVVSLSPEATLLGIEELGSNGKATTTRFETLFPATATGHTSTMTAGSGSGSGSRTGSGTSGEEATGVGAAAPAQETGAASSLTGAVQLTSFCVAAGTLVLAVLL